jgi:predicted MFS family arabinose efflux permease
VARRLLALITALMFLELVFFAVLSPLLPGLKRDFSLSTSQAGLLVAAYAIGAVVFAIPAVMVAARVGVRTTALASLAAFAVTSVAFGVADSYAGLIASRFLQGMAGAACFTSAMVWLLDVAPAERRGALLGLAFGVSEAGAIAGPLVGGVAAAIGRAATFSAVAGVCGALAFATSRFRAPPPAGSDRFGLRPLLASANVRTTALIIMIPAAILAGISVLAPLQQHRLGASVGEIAATFGIAAAVGILVRPIFGRWSDRRGPRGPVRFGLLASFPVVLVIPWIDSWLGVSLAVALALVLIGVLWAPLLVMLSNACVAAGVGQMMAVGVLNLSWPPGNALGAAGSGAIAQVAGQRWAYAVMAAPLLWGFMAISRDAEPAAQPMPVPPPS